MKRPLYTVLLEIVKLLVRVKRFFVFGILLLQRLFWKLDELVRNTIGYRFYTWQKRFDRYRIVAERVRDGRMLEFIGQRHILQLLMLCIAAGIVYPHTSLHTRDTTIIPGRETLLYTFAGPGDQNFEIEEVVVDRTTGFVGDESQRWTDGAVARPVGTVGTDTAPATTNRSLASLGPQGGSIIKPTIAPGGVIAITDEANATAQEAEQRGTTRYVVQPGDVLGSIATRFGVSVETILWANNLTLRSLIQPGQELVILPTTGIVHTVKSGDTLGRIARLYDAEIGDIISENNLPNAGTIGIGQELIIPGGTRIAAAPAPVTPRPTQPAVTTPSVSTPSTPPAPSTAEPSGSGYIWPTNVRTITQYFGWRHTGVDIAGPIGSPLYASRAGTVITSQCGWNGGYGCYVILDHGGGITTLYGHASELLVSVGETVSQGQTIALMGSTGRSTGPHIHFEVRVGNQRVNPFNYVN